MKNKLFRDVFIYIILFLLIGITSAVGSVNNIETTDETYEYYTYQKMTDLLQNLSVNHSDIMLLTSLGKTYEGRDIWMVKLSDNVSNDEDEPGILLMGAHHGNEKPSFEVLIYFIEHMVENYGKENIDDDLDGQINEDIIDGFNNDCDGLVDEDPSEDRVRNIINNTQIFVIPMVSPDSVEANTRKNCAPNHGPFGLRKKVTSYGVNLNRNYGYDWCLYQVFPFKYGIFSSFLDSSFNYRGPYPFSENETQGVRNFVDTHNISISLSYHSYGEVMMYPWMHTSLPTPDEELFISIGKNMSKINKYELLKDGFRNKTYLLPRFGGTLGTSENWLYGEHGIIAYTMELCKTRAPTDQNLVYDYLVKHVGVNLYACERSLTVENEKTSCSFS